MKTKKRLIVFLVCLALVGISGFTYAAIITSTDTTRDVSTSNLDIELVQTSENGKAIVDEKGIMGFDYNTVVPGTTVNESVAVKAGDTSKPSYVRVTVNRYWSKDGTRDVNEFIDPKEIELSKSSNDWVMIEDSDDSEVVYFYYRLPLGAGVTSSNLVDHFTVLGNVTGNTNRYSGYSSHLEFFAEAVQTMAGKDAMLAEWGVDATIDKDGVITNLVEQ